MRTVGRPWFVVVPILFWLAVGPSASEAEGLRIGLAETDITPPRDFPMAGYYFERRATGTHDPLKARAIVFQDGQKQAALLACDLIGISVDLSTEVRRQASAQTAIPFSNIMIAATHSHTAPDYSRDLFEYLGSGAASGGQTRSVYAPQLIRGMVEAIVKAQARTANATVEAGSARQETPVSFNRRFVMKDGSVQTWMSLLNPAVVRPAGPIDPEISLLLIRSTKKRQPLGLLSNFALHLDTVGGTLWSADYPSYIEQYVHSVLGKDTFSVFGTGCCGDINHVDPSRKEHNKTDFIGQALAKTIQDGMLHLHQADHPVLRVRRVQVSVPLQKVSREQITRARLVLLDARAGKKVDFFDQVRSYKALVLDQLRNKPLPGSSSDLISWGLSHTWAGMGDHLPVEVQVIGLGNEAAIVCLPGEMFVELGLAIKRASPFRTTLVVELANCMETIYVPTRAAYAGGSYEVTNSNLEPGSGEMLVEAALRLLREIASEDVRARNQ